MKTLIRYFAVGGVSALVDFLLFGFMIYGLGFPWFGAAFISFLLATSVNYLLSVRHVFASGVRFRKRHEVSLVFLVSGIGLLANQLVLYVCIERMSFYPLVAKIVATGMLYFWNFFARSRFIFRA